MTGSLAEPVVGSVCAERAHPEASAVAGPNHDPGPVLDQHNGQPVEHPGHGSGSDHCMHQHGLALGAVPGQLAVTSLNLTELVDQFAESPPRVVLPPPFHPPRA